MPNGFRNLFMLRSGSLVEGCSTCLESSVMDMSKAPETPGLNPDSLSPVFLETKLVFDFYFPSPAYSLSR